MTNCEKLPLKGFCRALLMGLRCLVILWSQLYVEPVTELVLRTNENGKSALVLPAHSSKEVKQKGITK